ncbi:MAG: dihydrodipicolinate synthase family protein [Vescimonas sp.]
MFKLTGSWVALPTPFAEDDKIDYKGFEILIDRQIRYGTSALFILGSAGETSLLTLEEKKEIVRETVKMTKGRIITFFNASMSTTDASIEFAKYCEDQGAEGLIFTVPNYVLLSQSAAFAHLDACFSSTKLPVGIYNNPSRLGVNVEPETIKKLYDLHDNFVVMKEAMPSNQQLAKERMLCGKDLNVLCCDFPKYSILLPTIAFGGNGAANIGGNIIPEEAAFYSRPWTSIEMMEECREAYFKYYPLLEALYMFSNPVCIKAALRMLGLPGGHLRKPYQELGGAKLEHLRTVMEDLGVFDKYKV